jgi:hypothetical protein
MTANQSVLCMIILLLDGKHGPLVHEYVPRVSMDPQHCSKRQADRCSHPHYNLLPVFTKVAFFARQPLSPATAPG